MSSPAPSAPLMPATDHRDLGRDMQLFHFQEEAPGSVFWHPNGWYIFEKLLSYIRRKLKTSGYVEVNTPQMLDVSFWQASGHWDKYRENMFVVPLEEEENGRAYALKPMSCPGNIQIYKADTRSYRDLPIRMAEFGRVLRREPSGARLGLMRVQAFTQDDAHIFCTPEQLEDEVVAMCQLIQTVYTDLGLADDITVHFSTRPEQRIGSEEDWDKAEAALLRVCERINMKWVLNEGDGAFYAPKLDFVIKDSHGRSWQCGTIQVDMNLPNRLDLQYIGADGERHRPHMVHRAIFGSLERFIGVLLEHYAGNLPLWLHPTPVVVASITSDTNDFVDSLVAQLKAEDIQAQADTRNEKISYKIREHVKARVPYILIAGKREAEAGTITVKQLGSDTQETLSVADALAKIRREATMP